MLSVCSVLKHYGFHRKVRIAQSQGKENILSPSHCHDELQCLSLTLRGKYRTVTIPRLAPESFSNSYFIGIMRKSRVHFAIIKHLQVTTTNKSIKLLNM